MKKLILLLIVAVVAFASSGIFAQNLSSGAKIPDGITNPSGNLNGPLNGTCLPCAIPEGEPYIPENGEDVTNGGCNYTPELFTDINMGDAFCGNINTYLYYSTPYRDLDWYKLILTTPQTVYWSSYAPFVGISIILEAPCPGTQLGGYYTPANTPFSWSIALPAGTYYLLFTTRYYLGDNVGAEYMVKVSTDDPGDPSTWCTAAIPTLSQWGLIILGCVLLGFGTFYIVRMRG